MHYNGEIPESYHRFVLFDSPQMGNFNNNYLSYLSH